MTGIVKSVTIYFPNGETEGYTVGKEGVTGIYVSDNTVKVMYAKTQTVFNGIPYEAEKDGVAIYK